MHSSQHIRALSQKSSSCSDDATELIEATGFRMGKEKGFANRKVQMLQQ